MNSVLKTLIWIALFPALSLAQPIAKPAFEAADIHVSAPGEKPDITVLPAGKLTLRYMTMRDIVAAAWSLKADYVTGGPDWLDQEHYDLVAKAAPAAPEAEMREMLKSFLIERFKLQVHVEKKPMPVLAMVVAEGGPKLQETRSGGTGASCELQPATEPKDGPALRTFACHDVDMDNLTGFLPRMASAYIDRPVIDQSGLKGSYDFTLAWTPRSSVQLAQPKGPTIFVALETQLGLRLEPGKHPMDVLVIDKLEPSPVR
jgi:uncharacterized protein (TIGR03435 family)